MKNAVVIGECNAFFDETMRRYAQRTNRDLAQRLRGFSVSDASGQSAGAAEFENKRLPGYRKEPWLIAGGSSFNGILAFFFARSFGKGN